MLIWGKRCSHKWTMVARNEDPTYSRFLHKCELCGKIKKTKL